MLISSVRFVSLVLTVLTFGLAFCHVVEMPSKMALRPSEYLATQQVYAMFGPVASVTEPGAILTAAWLAVLLRGRGRTFTLAVVGAVAVATALLVWFAVVNPVNPHWAAASRGAPPADFDALRARWEWGHAAHAAILFIGFAALLVSALVETPAPRPVEATRRPLGSRARG